MPSVAIITLGCKLNQAESEGIADAFLQAGWELVPEEQAADLFIVNTCTVTSKAEQKARRIIRKAVRENPASWCIITGCYAQMEAEALSRLEPEQERILVVTGDRKDRLLDLPQAYEGSLPILVRRWMDENESVLPTSTNYARSFRFNRLNRTGFSFHSRAFIKVQDGCNKRCSYCRVTLARGPSLSQDAQTLLHSLQDIEEAGFGEAVLTGVNICQYNDRGRDLAALLEHLLVGTKRIRIRLSSLEPDAIESLLGIMASPRICPHFHLSVQSGSPAILHKMRRGYSTDQVSAAVQALRSVKDDPFLACDIITGFPGEEMQDFEQTYALCKQAAFAGIHAFPYSARPGTAAFTFDSPVPEREACIRVERLLTLAHHERRAYISRHIGKEAVTVIEKNGTGLAENYLKIHLTAQEPVGTTVRCKITGFSSATGYDAEGVLV
ncbi:MAG: tRNA (N(6)-L-threonylcarbamoyladenosine(37)-C(2))-methylthiotransferase MtaB [Spirochaetaceae bacterium]|jgi:threonylcarbamoyladenosine tRNA methylthiotransferase MtaB|nr:tRNA (N(6)-L-threonylcarbamoyladenosine(37)-C(2))-methylthiotransferase MtaB [Spirochaetaceae bacterium]